MNQESGDLFLRYIAKPKKKSSREIYCDLHINKNNRMCFIFWMFFNAYRLCCAVARPIIIADCESHIAEIGIGLTGFGVFFSFLGIIFFFDKGLIAMAMQVFPNFSAELLSS